MTTTPHTVTHTVTHTVPPRSRAPATRAFAPARVPDAAAPSGHRRPAWSLLASEPLRAAVEAVQHFAEPDAALACPGGGHTVVLFPGLASDGLALWPLRRHLQRAGFRALDWGDGLNTGPQGDVHAWLDGLAERIQQRAAPARTLSLVGWSLGGLYARELAKRWPQRVRQVVTLGTPFNGSVDDTHVGWLFRLLNGQPAPDEAQLRDRLAEPPPVPTVSLYSRRDGVVAWQACQHDRPGPLCRDIEVQASHLGMGWAPEVLSRVTALLAHPALRAEAAR
ncbi:alpha/beta fold hydrolase [Roseateles sp. BYS87W]|uniref:Alpha/beta fold hydrolase n=1 Tax=Pelomonas baiyunensis TaxID=3299026 RepID=A0ABW7GYI9_9BURK